MELIQKILIEVILLVISMALPYLVVYGVKWLKAKIGKEKFQDLVAKAEIAVKAVEATIGRGNGFQKKREVELWLASKVKGITVEDIDKVIQAVWGELDKEMKKEGIKQ